MPQSITIVIIDKDVESVNALVKYLNNLGDSVSIEGVANSFENGFELIHRKRPMVVIMDICGEREVALQRITTILDRFPQTTIFTVCDDNSSETILKVMRAGATEYLLKPVSEVDLNSALQKLGRLYTVRTGGEAVSNRVFTLFSPKGGVGVTTIAINLATNIYEMTRKPTILVDLDLDAGDVTTFLNLKPLYTISDVTVNMTRLDKSFLKGVVTKHDSGIHILAEPQKVEEGVSVSAGDLRKVLNLLKTMFTYIVIDTSPSLDERTMAAIESSDKVFLTFVLSLPGIKNIQRYLNYFDRMGAKNKLKLIVNRYLKRGDIKIEDAEKVLNYPIFWNIPNDYGNAITCLNKGVPVSSGAPKSQLNLAIKDFAREIVGK